MLSHFHAAKKALSRGTLSCHKADQLTKDTEANLQNAIHLQQHITHLREALHAQIHTLSLLAHTFRGEARAGQTLFDGTLRELDGLDGQLNTALAMLKRARLPRVLVQPSAQQLESVSSGSSLETGNSAITRSKTLFDFADDQGIEQLKGGLRQAVDDLQESQEQLASLYATFDGHVRALDKTLALLPTDPILLLPQISQSHRQGDALSLSATAETCRAQQAEHLVSLAELLLSLSQHYDHTQTLSTSSAALPQDARAELREVVEEDAVQLEDVLAEMDERVVDLEEDLTFVTNHVAALQQVTQQLEEAFSVFEALDIDTPVHTLDDIRATRTTREMTLDMRREQLLGLAEQFTQFSRSYDALLLEIDRRAQHDAAVDALMEQTQRQLEQLQQQEMAERAAFLSMHGASLPEDIWHGIRDSPAGWVMQREQDAQTTPVLSQSVLQAARSRHAQWSQSR
ncbi:autophagy-related protein 17 [Protomyces lactucae-debilis]|uniref:Autophagy-related protein 17 n=1 Tax=Protomyces lactucae-debilis TaxID=2754530 RepID=A0A1Y2FM79_PROLT|nr:autophagy-related protein 17 [Protomyces lactucae-debilis]ORY85081.1 autophagy-related protein 17 [Protomyces lactucae-debilis]